MKNRNHSFQLLVTNYFLKCIVYTMECRTPVQIFGFIFSTFKRRNNNKKINEIVIFVSRIDF